MNGSKLVAIAAGLAFLGACRSTTTTAPSGSASGYHPSIDPSSFSATVDNPWFPLKPGSTWTYTGTKDGEPARDVMTVTTETKTIEGVPCVVVSDRLYLSGKLEERTSDYYTQDVDGNVWYFGEDTAELDEHGNVKNTEGSWLAGTDGAQPGIFMEADPVVGHSFRQEYLKGEAEDQFRVVRLDAAIDVPFGHYTNALLTEEWTVLEPKVLDHKFYVKGIGEVAEESVKGGNERSVLVSYVSG